MSFEKQFCEKCRRLAYCVDTRSIGLMPPKKPKQTWLCENCYAWTMENAHTKDTIRSIMIQCGIEDIEKI